MCDRNSREQYFTSAIFVPFCNWNGEGIFRQNTMNLRSPAQLKVQIAMMETPSFSSV
jgi:hypothetical protein